MKINVIIDANVIIDLISSRSKANLATLKLNLEEFIIANQGEWNYCLGYHTKLEVLPELNKKKRQLADESLTKLDLLECSNEVFDFAVKLKEHYLENESTKTYACRYCNFDTLLGALAFKNRAYILTRDRNDFPAPFFEEVMAYKCIKNSENNEFYNYYVLKPSYELLISDSD